MPVAERRVRWLLAVTQAFFGLALIALPTMWLKGETVLSARAIQFVTRERAEGVTSADVLLLYRGSSLLSVFKLSGECTTAYLAGALALVSAPLVLVRRFRLFAVSLAMLAAAVFIVIVNVARIAAIGATVSRWGPDRGFSFAHTYLGTTVSFVGTAIVGTVFLTVLLRMGIDHEASPARRA